MRGKISQYRYLQSEHWVLRCLGPVELGLEGLGRLGVFWPFAGSIKNLV
jgi:hypothetical protein